MSDNLIYIDRTQYNLGDCADISADELRKIASVPDDYDLWRVADWGYRAWLKGPMTMDEKVESRQFLGPGSPTPTRFYTAPKFINSGATNV